MTDISPQSTPPKVESTSGSSDTVAILAIIATAIVVLACIAACVISVVAFLNNPPW